MTKFERQTFLECRIFLYDHKSKKCIVEAQLSNFCEILIPFCLLSAGVFSLCGFTKFPFTLRSDITFSAILCKEKVFFLLQPLKKQLLDEFEHILAKPKQKAEANNTEF